MTPWPARQRPTPDGEGPPLNLLLEIKGYEVHNPELNNAKYGAARRWVTAVNNLGEFGRWVFEVCRDLAGLGNNLKSIAASAPPVVAAIS